MPSVRRILGEILRAACVPKRDLDATHECLFVGRFLFGSNLLEGEIAVAVVNHPLGEVPEVVVGVGHRIIERKLFFLRRIGRQLHAVGGAMVRNEDIHHELEEWLPEHHQVWKYGLVGGRVPEVLVLREDVVNKGCSRPPMAKDEQRVVL